MTNINLNNFKKAIFESNEDYNHLISIGEDEYVTAVFTAKNIRRDLKKHFPGFKFRVRSDSFSGGDAVDIRWNNGPSYNEVNDLIKKYQGGSFDSMQDMYEYSTSDFNKVYGYAKYVQCHRDIDRETLNNLKEALLSHFGKSAMMDEYWADRALSRYISNSEIPNNYSNIKVDVENDKFIFSKK